MGPDWKQYVIQHLPTLGINATREIEVVAELAAEFKQAYQDALLAGLKPDDARQQAEGHVLDWTVLAEELRAANGPPPAIVLSPGAPASMMSGLWNDIRYAFRALRLNPTFALIATL